MYIGVHVKCRLLLSDCNETWRQFFFSENTQISNFMEICPDKFHENLSRQISWKSVQTNLMKICPDKSHENLSRQISWKSVQTNFMKIRPVGAESCSMRTDMTNLIGTPCNFANAPKNHCQVFENISEARLFILQTKL